MQLDANTVSIVGASISIGGLIVSIAAFRRAGDADRRDRQAIITITKEWERYGSGFAIGTEQSATEQNPPPYRPDERWTISGTPTIADGLTLRPATSADDADEDQPNYTTSRVIIGLKNSGRSPATRARIGARVTGSYLPTYTLEMNEDLEYRAFPAEVTFVTLDPNVPRYVEIRNLTGIPVTVDFLSVVTDDVKQPIRIVADRLVLPSRS